MSRLKPGATYIYERVDNVVYAREIGSPSNTRIEIGRDYQTRDSINWYDLLEQAKTNPTLQAAVDECIMIYKLSKEYKDV